MPGLPEETPLVVGNEALPERLPVYSCRQCGGWFGKSSTTCPMCSSTGIEHLIPYGKGTCAMGKPRDQCCGQPWPYCDGDQFIEVRPHDLPARVDEKATSEEKI